ncbi:hypothetical protein BCPG3_080 [Bacillus phage BCPG3]|uniref:Uncharacterized protein n=2 Tax=Wphvirus TaxID=1922327 RepID=W5QUU1_9CAUD|nr:hypothetical protein BPS13_0076 [Bacillus phage BPS13]YP_009002961.1 hypothetical protein BPS10C_075 [Bacillus phage BPS10C]QQO38918.1 hypothetical protein BCPG1_187 [Bacillus phage BCPG1]QSJ04397.1 hypothetical protein BCPG3_080 [Bacillus phage BCPG3]QSJ04609.1 hypothetical protein BCP18_077 [Bacillus phage BCP18]AEZ50255.1 hypothetical protein BPS13_0076 [Bacillus phage BPS13]AGI12072.1 hypothetical protein BPS10C_075 [Bacillus phage BPS10C]
MTIRQDAQQVIQSACDIASEIIRIEKHVKDAKHLIDNYVDDVNTPKYDGIMKSLNKALDKLEALEARI